MEKGARLLWHGEASVDIGPHGYKKTFFVHRCEPWTDETLVAAEATLAFATAAKDLKAWNLVLTSERDGSGFRINLDIPEDKACLFPNGSAVTGFWKKTKEIGFGTLVALETSLEEPVSENQIEP